MRSEGYSTLGEIRSTLGGIDLPSNFEDLRRSTMCTSSASDCACILRIMLARCALIVGSVIPSGLGDSEFSGSVLIEQSGCNEFEHFAFSRRQRFEPVAQCIRLGPLQPGLAVSPCWTIASRSRCVDGARWTLVRSVREEPRRSNVWSCSTRGGRLFRPGRASPRWPVQSAPGLA